MITNKSKLSYISDLVCYYDLFRHDIKVDDFFTMTLKRILSLDDEEMIFDYFHNFYTECYKRFRKELEK